MYACNAHARAGIQKLFPEKSADLLTMYRVYSFLLAVKTLFVQFSQFLNCQTFCALSNMRCISPGFLLVVKMLVLIPVFIIVFVPDTPETSQDLISGTFLIVRVICIGFVAFLL